MNFKLTETKHKHVLFLFTAAVILFLWLNHSSNSEENAQPSDKHHMEKYKMEATWAKSNHRSNNSMKTGMKAAVSLTHKSISVTISTTTQSAPRPPRIPLIFHQIYKDTALPAPYGICFYSLLRNHRFRDGRHDRNASAYRGEFDYYFWTDQSIKEYREDHSTAANAADNASAGRLGKEFEYFKSARETVEVADMVRYFFLYEYGGIYMDLDMEPVSSFLPLLERGYPCILSEENPIQVNSVWGSGFGVTNAIMLCRPRHPFLKLLIDSLPEFKDKYHVLLRTGPRFVTAVLERYQAADKKRAEECANDSSSRDDCIFIVSPYVFDTFHYIHTHRYKDYCRGKLIDATPDAIARDNMLRYCRDYIAGIEQSGTATELANNLERLAVHHYLHMGYRTGSDRNSATNPFDVGNLIRGYWMYKPKAGIKYIPSGFD